MIALSVNLNKIALIRNSRDTTNPDLLEHARMAIAAGGDRGTLRRGIGQERLDLFHRVDIDHRALGHAVFAPVAHLHGIGLLKEGLGEVGVLYLLQSGSVVPKASLSYVS